MCRMMIGIVQTEKGKRMPDFIEVEEAVDIVVDWLTDLAETGGDFNASDLYDLMKQRGTIYTSEEQEE